MRLPGISDQRLKKGADLDHVVWQNRVVSETLAGDKGYPSRSNSSLATHGASPERVKIMLEEDTNLLRREQKNGLRLFGTPFHKDIDSFKEKYLNNPKMQEHLKDILSGNNYIKPKVGTISIQQLDFQTLSSKKHSVSALKTPNHRLSHLPLLTPVKMGREQPLSLVESRPLQPIPHGDRMNPPKDGSSSVDVIPDKRRAIEEEDTVSDYSDINHDDYLQKLTSTHEARYKALQVHE